MQDELKNLEDNPKEFWRKIGKIGVGNNRQSIPMEVKMEDNSICTDPKIVLDKWKCDFSNMLNSGNLYETTEKDVNSCIITDDILDSEITNEEVVNILKLSKAGKSPGCDEIPMEMYKNQTAINALTQVFNICYNTGMIPELWSRGIITPIPKSSTSDPRDPMSYRGITLAPTSYKLYCGVLNSRLTVKLDDLNFIHDEQNGFRSNLNEVKSLNVGIPIEEEKICILLYADDIVLLAENESDLQMLLNVLHMWCHTNDISVNLSKSKIIHFRPPSFPRSIYTFMLGNDNIETVIQYTYLGLHLTEFLNYDLMAKAIAKSASRALGLLIAKCKSNGGFCYSTYTKLFDTLVWSVIDYGASIWGTREFSCINAVKNRAMRFFMGVGKYTPNLSLYGDMG
ncbi:uncharacterized protein [Mytilus edulis]|uniref:uncharacterized protein n=1 Tax=Mytilus edulis TaxID=6550 RepID=UPI0039F10BF6